VIVVCWNAEDVLGRCLEHLLEQDYPNYEVIVVDDGSRDDTVAVAEAAAARGELKIVRSARNRGCPSARNLGLRHAHGEIVAFVDADGFAAPDWLRGIVAAFAGDETIGGVASTVFYDDNPLVLNGAGGTVNRQGWAADLSMNESYESARIVAEALYPMGCGMAIRREALARVGPFDDRMLNYYDDVDYGVRLWRAGYRVAVASEAWIDHRATLGDSTRKRLLCERHRMRVVLKHAPASDLGQWAANELRALRAAPMPVRRRKLAAFAWNVRHLPSALARRWRLRRTTLAPRALVDDSWGDGFPAGVPLRLRPTPERAGGSVEMADPDSEAQLPYGWFPVESIEGRSYRWAGTRAAALVRLERPARRLRLDYAHPPINTGGLDVRIRRVGSADPLQPVWQTRLAWQYIARSVENHPLQLPAGDYEVVFVGARGWSDPPRETRSLALALSSLSFADSFEVAPGGLDMAAAAAEEQLVNGWFEAEEGPSGRYRWGAARAAAVVRLAEPARSSRLIYRLPPGSIGRVRVALTPLGTSRAAWSTEMPWLDSDWREDSFVLALAAGDYLLSFEAETTWSNPEGRQRTTSGENRSLGFAVSSFVLIGS
jgi:GT2 family glycosyltransferase